MTERAAPVERVEAVCWACGGSGHRVRVAPLRFLPCWMCAGRRGFKLIRDAETWREPPTAPGWNVAPGPNTGEVKEPSR